ncbi:NAD(P)H-quinone oxidoreductase [Opitutaceae bacterium TAV4]|nr:NAD(P)H-quinone oxidoreductase [Opitutaceae bacterium TAV4]RRK00267.1 NAD(P)H-quinone oxidoreductase [Opitutaceae bacterium TAV3]
MHAILVDSNKHLVWTEVPDPVRRENEVVIEVRAAALNRADLMQREGNYPPPPGWPEWMGLEVAGVVLEAPAQGRWKRGDKVCALLGGGGYAEKVAVPADMALPVPSGLSMAEAAALPEAFATSYLNLCIEGGMTAGDTVFIQAGASGLGIAAIQLAKELGATVMTTVGSEEKARFVQKLGADIVVNRRSDDLATIMEKYPVNIALDCVAGPGLGANVIRMAPGGRWIVIATLAGAKTEIDMNAFFRRGLRLIGSTLRSRTSEMKAQFLSELEALLWGKFASGKIKPVIYKTLSITQAEQAHAILQNQENIGKVVLTL